MKYIIGIALITGAILAVGSVDGRPIIYQAEANEVIKEVVLIETKKEEVVWSKERIDQEIVDVATKYGVSAEKMRRTIACESMGSTTIQSYHIRSDGTREQSFGLVQIFLPAHPHVTKEQAIDPVFALNFMGKHFAEGNARIWSCYRHIYG